MSGGVQMRGNRVPDTVVLCIDRAASPEHRRTFIERIEAILPHLNWRTHFFIVSEGLPDEMEYSRR